MFKEGTFLIGGGGEIGCFRGEGHPKNMGPLGRVNP